ncbi:hypothetical protein Dimus_016299, partial [Dionaea muscipula]
ISRAFVAELGSKMIRFGQADEDHVIRVSDGPITRARVKAFQDSLLRLVRCILAQSYTWSLSGEADDSFRSLLRIHEDGAQAEQAPDIQDQVPDIQPFCIA